MRGARKFDAVERLTLVPPRWDKDEPAADRAEGFLRLYCDEEWEGGGDGEEADVGESGC